MAFAEIIGIALALSVDGFTVALATGLSQRLVPLARSVRLAMSFGSAQSLMLAIGLLAGRKVHVVTGISPWLAFIVMGWVGARMMAGAARESETHVSAVRDPMRGLSLAALSLGTSLDGLAIGIPLGGLGSSIGSVVPITGAVVASVTLLGALLGTRIGQLWGRRAGWAGGAALCLLGARILISHW
jgi:putative Mn2+ efflux pump MntP